MDDLAAFKLGEHAITLSVNSYRNYFFAETKDCTELAQLVAEAFNDFAVSEFQQLRALVQQGDFHAQRGEHGCVLNPNHPGTNYDQISWNFFQFVHLVGVKNAFAVDRNMVIVRRTGAACDENIGSANYERALFAYYLNRLGIQETCTSLEGGDVISPQLALMTSISRAMTA